MDTKQWFQEITCKEFEGPSINTNSDFNISSLLYNYGRKQLKTNCGY
jgi:hypothetical protein